MTGVRTVGFFLPLYYYPMPESYGNPDCQRLRRMMPVLIDTNVLYRVHQVVLPTFIAPASRLFTSSLWIPVHYRLRSKVYWCNAQGAALSL